MLVVSKLSLLILFLATIVKCEDEMNLHVSIVEADDHNEFFANEQLSSTNNFNINEQVVDEKTAQEKIEDLCSKLTCGIGETCNINDGVAACECIEQCELPKDERQQICTSSNQTFESDCHFLRQKCWCNKNDQKCTDYGVINDKLDYYGACRSIDHCSDEQKKVFPGRMKIWLDEVLHILNDRKDLDPKYLTLVKLADQMKSNNAEKYWTYGVAFEFCQLDKSKDHKIQKDELKTLVASIKALENCIQPFLEECDTDQNDVITDNEWGQCLDLKDEDMMLLRKYC